MSENIKRLICTFYDKGLNVDDILERLDLTDEHYDTVERIINEHLHALHDCEHPSEPGDGYFED
jgi:hypothetical protein